MSIRTRNLTVDDAHAALSLYNELTLGPDATDEDAFYWVLAHPGTEILGALVGGRPQAMATLHILPNVTWNARPYRLIENVVTARAFRKQGFGRAVMQAAISIAWAADAYKVMLLTGQKRGAKGFYEAVGFASEDKHAMVIRRS